MTTAEGCFESVGPREAGGGKRFLFLILLAVTIALALGVVAHAHASQKHAEAGAIRRCLDNNGPYMVMKHKWGDTYYLLCQIDKNNWGLQAIDRWGHEKTAFSPGDGSFRDLMDYVNKFAVRFKGRLPWLK